VQAELAPVQARLDTHADETVAKASRRAYGFFHLCPEHTSRVIRRFCFNSNVTL